MSKDPEIQVLTSDDIQLTMDNTDIRYNLSDNITQRLILPTFVADFFSPFPTVIFSFMFLRLNVPSVDIQ